MGGAANDFELLERYARARDEPAFAEIVRRHLNLVYSSAVRRVGDRHLAEDVTQAVFVILAKKPKSVRSSQPLSAWLLTTVRYAAANALKLEARRRKHEAAAQRAAMMNGACSANPTDVLLWQEVAAQLDDAVLKLPATDRRAILMRYFEDRPIGDIAAELRVSEGAAKQRLSRSVQKLRQRLEGAGASVLPAAGAASFATALATHAVRAAPAGLMHSAVAAALGGATAATAGTAGITIAKGAIAMMTWTKTKIAAGVVAASMLGTGALLTINPAGAQGPNPSDPLAAAPAAPAADAQKPSGDEEDDSKPSLRSAPPVVVRSVPQSGAATVDPATTEIRVTYSKNMQDGSWSWSTWGEENFPKTTGKPRYMDDKRTCVLPVKLEPNKFYAIWLNSNNFGNFKDTAGRPAVPYLLVFKTRG